MREEHANEPSIAWDPEYVSNGSHYDMINNVPTGSSERHTTTWTAPLTMTSHSMAQLTTTSLSTTPCFTTSLSPTPLLTAVAVDVPYISQCTTNIDVPTGPLPMLTTTPPSPHTLAKLSKPFPCPTQFCIKSYKSLYGLKYHLKHGRCQPPSSDSNMVPLPKHESDDTHPFFCGIGSCERRYTTAASLRYHYENTGEHGTYGLSLIENGTHPILLTRGPSFWKPRKFRKPRPTGNMQAPMRTLQCQSSSSSHT